MVLTRGVGGWHGIALVPVAFTIAATGGSAQEPADTAPARVQVNLDLVRVLEDPLSGADIVLQPGDSLHVPEFEPTVRVTGAVYTPTSVVYREGADLDYYLGNAGGLTSFADAGRISVRYANG